MSNGGKNWIPLIAALVIIVVVIAAAVAYVMWPDDENGDDDPLYLHISYTLTTPDVADPIVKMSVDLNGDGVIDQVRELTPEMLSAAFYSSSLETEVFSLDPDHSSFTFTIEVFNGTSKLFYSVDETRTGPTVSGSSDSWNFTPSFESGNCWLVIGYSVTPLDENMQMPG